MRIRYMGILYTKKNTCNIMKTSSYYRSEFTVKKQSTEFVSLKQD